MLENNETTVSGKLSTEEAISLLQKSSGDNVTIIIKSVRRSSATLCNGECDPISLLPPSLLVDRGDGKGRLLHRAAFKRAFDRGLLVVENDRIVSKFNSVCALAYFCGRVFCGDYSRKTRGYSCWKKGFLKFPEKSMIIVFGIENLREIRKEYIKNKKIFVGYQVVDSLFFK